MTPYYGHHNPIGLVAPVILSLLLIPACSGKASNARPDSTRVAAKNDSTVMFGKTKLQSFQAKTGAVVVLGFSNVASVPGLYSGRAEVVARELTDATSGMKVQGISIQITRPGTFERKETSYIDYDELESLLRGIDYISKIDRNPTKLADFQADYRTKGDLVVSTFSDNSGNTLASLTSGSIGGVSAFFPMSRLSDLRSAIARGKALLDSISPRDSTK